MEQVSDRIFVYGTLMPGHLRWPMLEPWAASAVPCTVAGTLYDTGWGWPAAAFGTGAGIPGWVITLRNHDPVALWQTLDEMEGIGAEPDPRVDPYRRIEVHGCPGGPAWAYDATRIEPGWEPIEAWEGRPER
jgi:gamma-glutamylcyclotransferase (GGCT)/AIG2-like uncharacterized protein YtfP